MPAGICPRCGATMVWRRARLSGELYKGCTNYQGGCRYHERSYKRTPKSLKYKQRKRQTEKTREEYSEYDLYVDQSLMGPLYEKAEPDYWSLKGTRKEGWARKLKSRLKKIIKRSR